MLLPKKANTSLSGVYVCREINNYCEDIYIIYIYTVEPPNNGQLGTMQAFCPLFGGWSLFEVNQYFHLKCHSSCCCRYAMKNWTIIFTTSNGTIIIISDISSNS